MRTLILLLPLAVVFSTGDRCQADEGDPVAIIRLPGGDVAIETMWNQSVVITDSPSDLTSKIPGVDIVGGGLAKTYKPPAGRFLLDANDANANHALDRPANQVQVAWQPADKVSQLSANAIKIRQLDALLLLIQVDGVRILHITNPDAGAFASNEHDPLIKDCDVLIAQGTAESNPQAKMVADTIGARRLVVNTKADLPEAKIVSGNTLAISSINKPESVQLLVLNSEATQLSDELRELIRRKEQACEASQQVFGKLSVAQLNFRPSNGSHTPRWNAEHMMGRELLFFSQIFHAQDESIRTVDLNPKQMPPDYKAQHPDWTGVEEARQMERVSAFTRRFAYLLDDLPLDRKAPGSGWTPRALLRQMERHYNEHTANVKQKFQLPDWPGN